MKKKFSADHFMDTKFDTAADKARFTNQFIAFAESDFAESRFYETVYKRLMYLFGHIAHFNRVGFYDVWFSSDAAKLRFITNAVDHISWNGEWADVESAIRKYLIDGKLAEMYRNKIYNALETHERAELARLKAKYETEHTTEAPKC